LKTSKLKSRLLIATLAIGVGLAVLLLGHRIPWIQQFNSGCVKASSSSPNLIFDEDVASNTISARTLSVQADRGRDFQIIHITDDPDHIFEHTPPSPLDYAVLIESLRNRGYNQVVLATRMTWDDEPGLEAKGLSGRLALFQSSVIAIPVTRGATAQPLPDALQRALIPFSKVTGNHKLIPIVNQVSLPAHAGGGAQTLAGFDKIESSPASEGSIPLLAQWEGQGLIPSLELLSVMMAHNVSPSDLIVHSGKYIRLGKNGPVLPLDAYGQTPRPSSEAPLITAAALRAETLITQKTATPVTDQDQVCLIHAVGEKTIPTSLLSATRMNDLLTLAKVSPVPGAAKAYRRLPRWAEIVILVDIALAACWFAGFTLWNRHFAFALTAAFLLPLLLSMMDITQHWFGLSAPIATLITAWLIPVNRRKHTSPMQEYSTSDPKPVIRA
jgi:hypothetical protein